MRKPVVVVCFVYVEKGMVVHIEDIAEVSTSTALRAFLMNIKLV